MADPNHPTIVLAVDHADAATVAGAHLGQRAARIVTPRSRNGARGCIGNALVITPAILAHPAFPDLLEEVLPAFATVGAARDLIAPGIMDELDASPEVAEGRPVLEYVCQMHGTSPVACCALSRARQVGKWA
ncbi:MAG TPA: hypothetical protein VIL55_11300 [Naasia sp.]|jgi:hypothetical protein